jgi:hypothetical protein
MRRNAKRARREVLFILRSAFPCLFSASKLELNKPRCPADTAQCAAMHSKATQCPAMRPTATILAPSGSDARGHQRCGVVSHPKDRPMPPRKSPTTVRSRNVYICRPEPTCVSRGQHLPAMLTCACKRQRRLHLQAGAGSCRNPKTCADSRRQAPASASMCQHLQAEAGSCWHLKVGRSLSSEGAPCR